MLKHYFKSFIIRKMPKIFAIIFLVFCGSIIAYAQEKPKKKKDIFPKGKKDDAERIARYAKEKAESYFIEGMKFYSLKDYNEALDEFIKSEDADPKAASIKFQIAKTHYMLEDFEQSKKYLEKAISLDKSNPFFYDLQIDIYFLERNSTKIIETINSLIDNVENADKNYYFDLASAYIQTSDFKKALSVFQEIESEFGFSDRLIDLQQRCYISLGEEEKAIELGEELLKNSPQNQEYLNTHIQMLTSLKRFEEVEKWLKVYSENFDVTGEWHLLIARIYDAQGKEKEFTKHAEIAFADGSISFDQKIQLVVKYLPYGEKQADKISKGKKLTKIIYETHTEQQKACELYADFLLLENNLIEARDVYLQSLKINANNFNLWQKVVELDTQLGQYEALLDHTDQAIIMFPNQPYFYLFNGLGHQLTNDHEVAVAVLEQAQMLAIDADKTLKVQLYSQLGDVYQHIENFEKSNEAYENALRLDTHNIYVLNNYSYYLSERNENLEKAREMGKKLISLSPENPSYLDTYGWVLYMSELYAEARVYLEKAASVSSGTSVIIEHFGDVLYKLGEIDQAVIQWQKAKQLGGNHSKNLDRKLAERKLID